MKLALLAISMLAATAAMAQYNPIELAKDSHPTSSLKPPTIGCLYSFGGSVSRSGPTLSDSMLQGKVTLISFWFRRCRPCVAELDALNRLYQNLKGSSAFQLISICPDTPEALANTIKEYAVAYTSLTANACRRLNSGMGYPTTIIVDRRGRVTYVNSGGKVEPMQVEKDILQLENRIRALLENQ